MSVTVYYLLHESHQVSLRDSLMPPRKRGRAAAAANAEAAEEPGSTELADLTKKVDVLVRVAATQLLQPTTGKDIAAVLTSVEEALARTQQRRPAEEEDDEGTEVQSEEEAEEEDEADGEEDEAGGEEEESERPATRQDIEELLKELQKMKMSSKGDHIFGYCNTSPWDNRGKYCGVCSSRWYPGCDWTCGNGKWACFKCQVYLCGFECLSDHANKGIGNTCPRGKWIYKLKEDMMAVKEGPTPRA